VDKVAIAGNGDAANATDGLVSVNSASVRFGGFPDGDQRTRVIPYCHGSIVLDPCAGGYLTNVSVLYVDHVATGIDLSRVTCEQHTERVVAKQTSAK
jgi:hypothetical protein